MKFKLLSIFLFLYPALLFSQSDSTFRKENLTDTLNNQYNLPVFSTTGSDADSDNDQQDMSSLLQSSRDVFTQFASFQFGVARFRMRGYAPENQMVLINGIKIENPETGYASWSNWGGLNDVTRYTENRVGLVANRYAFSGIGGYTNIDSRASSFKRGTRFSYANSNRIFRNRLMLTHSSGMQKNGWAYTLSASNRNGSQVYIPGTFINASSYYISIDKKINENHLLSFTGFVAPVEQGRSSAEQLEAYELAGSHYYNSLWGKQNGKVRNASVSRAQRPMLMLTHNFKSNRNANLNTSFFYNYGTMGLTSINWTNAYNPRPNYYRNFPSYYYDKGDTISGDFIKKRWDDINYRQVNWDKLIALNRANLFVLPSQVGQIINTDETRARYILENKVEELKNVGFNTVYSFRQKDLFISMGLNGNIYRNRKYKILEDLLGATYWLDYDQFAQNLGVDPVIQQNDISNPDRKVKQGERFGYDYSINYNKVEVWTQAEYTLDKIDLYGAINFSDTKIWREGFIANGKFPFNSKGSSRIFNFMNYGLKGGLTFKITGRHFIVVNACFLNRAPEAANIFVSPRVRNTIVDGVKNENVTSADINYQAKYPGLKLRATYYYSQINNQIWLKTYWHDTYNNNVNLIMKGVNQNHQGLELGLEKTLFTSQTFQFAFGFGQNVYTSRPTLEVWQDNNEASLYSGRTSYIKNYRIGGSPQMVSGIGYKFNGKKFWFAGIYFNYFDNSFLEINPDRRTAQAIEKYLSNEKNQYEAIVNQAKLNSYYLINFNAGKSFRLFGKYYLNFNLSINNVLNNQNILIGGFEQLRWDYSNINKFDNKYYYMTGATYFVIVNLTI